MKNILVCSFGFKTGGGGPTAIDCRSLPNPHKIVALRNLTGLDKAVQDYVRGSAGFEDKMCRALERARTGENVYFGCYGGRHRSVAMAELLSRKLMEYGITHVVQHRDL